MTSKQSPTGKSPKKPSPDDVLRKLLQTPPQPKKKPDHKTGQEKA